MPDETAPIIARRRGGDLTLDQIGEMQRGTASLMLEISERFWIMYYAAQADNWNMARHQLSELRKTTKMVEAVSPKYIEQLAAYDRDFLRPVEEAIAARDWPRFDAAYRRGIDGINAAHEATNHGYIRWQLPDTPPPYLRLRLDGKPGK